MKEIPLSRGMVALVDDDDHEALSQYKWSVAEVSPGHIYAVSTTRVEGRRATTYMHRMITDAPRGKVVDHIDGNTLNNQRDNLRLCFTHQNIAHRKGPNRDSTSGYIGVCWYPRYKKWMSHICHKSKRHTIGYFDTAEQAARARDKKARELHGAFACLNFEETAQ